jgi:hypothetical protein
VAVVGAAAADAAAAADDDADQPTVRFTRNTFRTIDRERTTL